MKEFFEPLSQHTVASGAGCALSLCVRVRRPSLPGDDCSIYLFILLARQSLCGGGVPFSHPSLGLCVFFLFCARETFHGLCSRPHAPWARQRRATMARGGAQRPCGARLAACCGNSLGGLSRPLHPPPAIDGVSGEALVRKEKRNGALPIAALHAVAVTPTLLCRSKAPVLCFLAAEI